ncbi:MAG: S-adenosylmethionine:tRNA ribosyltransferase-isomerase [Ignavibacteria bacterium]|nr:S-adenosylmethionine:tRNA ribosyltransferase-isomerase [Ignavibacteria bacterium]
MPIPDFAPSLNTANFFYDLPRDNIAQYPLADRDQSRLLVFSRSRREISHRIFSDLPSLLPRDSCVVVNNSRVVSARLFLKKLSGGKVEIFLTEPVSPVHDPAIVLHHHGPSVWQCMIGGRNVDAGTILRDKADTLEALVISRNGTEGVVKLTWSSDESLSVVLSRLGHVPLPPYIHRPDDDADAERYQTIYAQNEGSVAAPTAGLHFTERTLSGLAEKNVTINPITLHVGLGTFKLIDVGNIRDYVMHAERFEFTASFINKMINNLSSDHRFVTCVGTTSLRALESVRWFGAKLVCNNGIATCVTVEQWSAYNPDLQQVGILESFQAVANWMIDSGRIHTAGYTSLLIAPGCSLGTANALITNFHQPGNTLLMLVAAFAGEEHWKDIYQSALEHSYRMLSYGDASLITT